MTIAMTAPLRRGVARSQGPAWNQPRVGPLSNDDLRLLALIATGLPLSSVARRLEISDRTVRRRTTLICETLGLSTTIESVAWAARRHLI